MVVIQRSHLAITAISVTLAISLAGIIPSTGEENPVANSSSSNNNKCRILLIQGANMSYLGKRDPEKYGSTTAAQLDEMLRSHAREKGYEIEIFHTNTEGVAIDKVYSAVESGIDGIVMNPGGFTYGGYSLRDALIAVPVPYVEVHMLSERDWSGDSVTGAAADGVISGFGTQSYVLGLEAMLHKTSLGE